MFLWGIHGQIWAVLWAEFIYEQLCEVVCLSASRAILLKITD